VDAATEKMVGSAEQPKPPNTTSNS
jgi:hypothetical protein